MWRRLRTMICVSLFCCFHFSFPPFAQAQTPTPVAPVSEWLATVDSATQQVVLRWRPSTDSATMGYHICTGIPCLNYDTVFGRFDTSFICVDHSPEEAHSYRLHVFDSAYNVSELTPSFGNVVLLAEVPECDTVVRCRWTPYEGIPSWYGTLHYELETRMEPLDSTFIGRVGMNAGEPLEWSFVLPDTVTRVWLRVVVDEGVFSRFFRSESNIVMVERRTIDTATVVGISEIDYDSLRNVVNLTFDVDTAFEYTLYRSIDGGAWHEATTFRPRQNPYHYSDRDVNPYDSLYCYRLEVFDACGMNPRYSDVAQVVMPEPVVPAGAIPNVVVAGDPDNSTFLPRLRGLKGDLYELHIYDRKGILVFHTDDAEQAWNPADVSQGAYVFSLRVRFVNNTVKTYTGTVIVLK